METENNNISKEKKLNNNLKTEENENKSNKQKKVEKKSKKRLGIRTILVFLVLLIFAIGSFISFRSEYLNITEISQEYEDVFYQNIRNKYTIFGVSSILVYIFTYVLNKFKKRGLKKFFE